MSALITAFGFSAVAGCQLAYFNAVQHMQVGVALLIEYTAPVAVIGWLWLRRGQRPGRLTVAGAALAAGGLVLVLDLVSGRRLRAWWACCWALGGDGRLAVYFVISADETNGLPPIVLAAGGLIVGAAHAGRGRRGRRGAHACVHRGRAYTGVTVPWWLPMLGLGLVAAALAYVTGIAASRRLGSRLASFVALLEVLAALVFAWLLLGELPRSDPAASADC